MFCYQCEQTAQGGCTIFGMCGKEADVAALQDLLIYELEGLAVYAQALLQRGEPIAPAVHRTVIDSLFATLTNVNFDRAYFLRQLRAVAEVKDQLCQRAGLNQASLPAAARYELPTSEDAIQNDANLINLRGGAGLEDDIQSMKDTLLFGLKGMAAYAHHAWVLGYTDQQVNEFFYTGLAAELAEQVTLDELVKLAMDFGQVNLRCMELLDQANTETFGHPEPTQILISKKTGPFIVISGHDLYDLKQLLEQTAGTGVQVYTHGEMLPALAYPELKKYPHLIGNYGSAWQNQQREFANLPGCILMTTNCLMEPTESYRDRIFTTGLVGWADVTHIAEEADGRKDFSAIIQKALELGGWTADEPERRILTGFARQATLSHANEIINAVKSGQIRHFFLVGGCDGAKARRNYFSDFVEQTPGDSVVLTLACGKFRFNEQELGTVAGLPRLLDVGQCNDTYSAVQIAVALANAFECEVNDLPLTLVLSWYEQKAVCILLSLLSLGIRNIYLGPSLPAFLSPNVVAFLVKTFNIQTISSPQADLAAILN